MEVDVAVQAKTVLAYSVIIAETATQVEAIVLPAHGYG